MASVNKVMLHRLYVVEKKSIPDVSKEIGMGLSATRRLLLTEGITLRSRADGIRAASEKLGKHLLGKKRVFTPEWKEHIRTARQAHGEQHAAGVSHKTGGYSEFTRGPNKGRSVHVVLMEEHIGRRLNPGEVVHHIDGNRQNNDISNLQLMTRSEHASLHILERIQGENNGKR